MKTPTPQPAIEAAKEIFDEMNAIVSPLSGRLTPPDIARDVVRDFARMIAEHTQLAELLEDRALWEFVNASGLSVVKDSYAGRDVWACFDAYPAKPEGTNNPFPMFDTPINAVRAARAAQKGEGK